MAIAQIWVGGILAAIEQIFIMLAMVMVAAIINIPIVAAQTIADTTAADSIIIAGDTTTQCISTEFLQW